MTPLGLAVIGAGAIGKRHAEHVAGQKGAMLWAVVDPAPAGEQLAASLGSRWFARFADLLSAGRPDGVIIATPNRLHVEHGLEAVSAGIPALVEKPVADSLTGAARLVEVAEAAGVPLLVGHHRRYNPMVQVAKKVIDSGRLGQIVSVHGDFWLMKPDDYFDVAWRREKGAGPVLMNLIHDVDLFRYFFGEIVSVHAQESNVVRGNTVEETAVVLLRFANGILGTMNISDSIVAPWSWELTAGENPAYPRQDQACYKIGGTHGSMTLPQLEVWSNPGKRSWWEPLRSERLTFVPEDPLAVQIRHFCEVIGGRVKPLVPGREGLNTLRVIAAAKQSAESGAMIRLN